MNKLFVVIAQLSHFAPALLRRDRASRRCRSKRILMYQSADVGPRGAVAGAQVFLSAELPGNGKVVTGAPYSATRYDRNDSSFG